MMLATQSDRCICPIREEHAIRSINNGHDILERLWCTIHVQKDVSLLGTFLLVTFCVLFLPLVWRKTLFVASLWPSLRANLSILAPEVFR